MMSSPSIGGQKIDQSDVNPPEIQFQAEEEPEASVQDSKQAESNLKHAGPSDSLSSALAQAYAPAPGAGISQDDDLQEAFDVFGAFLWKWDCTDAVEEGGAACDRHDPK
jgi:hypothetical protein